MGTKAKQNKIQRIIMFPVRVLVKARDSYVKGMSSFGQRGSFGGFGGAPTATHLSYLPRSYTISSTSSRSNYESEDTRELIRAASVKILGGRLTDENMNSRPVVQVPVVVPRSCSAGMRRIDENSPCEFGEEDEGFRVTKAEVMYPRSKSYAVAKKSPFDF